jgi:hypothetical protein
LPNRLGQAAAGGLVGNTLAGGSLTMRVLAQTSGSSPVSSCATNADALKAVTWFDAPGLSRDRAARSASAASVSGAVSGSSRARTPRSAASRKVSNSSAPVRSLRQMQCGRSRLCSAARSMSMRAVKALSGLPSG